ncbi:MAG: ATP-binding protein [Candidatus Sulfotelmatobacter sp.]
MRKHQSVKATENIPFLFGTGFLHDHVGQIIDDPAVAVVELIANSYDAGADKVTVVWPDLPGRILSTTDNGTA